MSIKYSNVLKHIHNFINVFAMQTFSCTIYQLIILSFHYNAKTCKMNVKICTKTRWKQPQKNELIFYVMTRTSFIQNRTKRCLEEVKEINDTRPIPLIIIIFFSSFLSCFLHIVASLFNFFLLLCVCPYANTTLRKMKISDSTVYCHCKSP